MKYRTIEDGDQVELVLEGRLTFDEHSACRSLIAEMEDWAFQKQIINVCELDQIDSAGLGLLLRMKEACDEAGRELHVRVPGDGQVAKMLSVAKFDQLVPTI